MCDLEGIGVTSMSKLIRRVEGLGRMCPNLDLSCEETPSDGNGNPGWIVQVPHRNFFGLL